VVILPPSSSIQSPVEGFEEDQPAEFVGQSHGGESEEEIRTFPHSFVEPIRAADNECDRETDIALLHQKLRKVIGRHILPALIERNENILSSECFEQAIRFFFHLPLGTVLFACGKFLDIEHRKRGEALAVFPASF